MSSSQAEALYLERYQLKTDPFSSGGGRFPLHTPRRKNVLEQLVHFSRYGDFMLLVTGPRGSGKTRLCKALLAADKEQAVSLSLSAHHVVEGAVLLQHLAQHLQAKQSDVQGLLERIGQLKDDGRTVHILIDDAHALNESALLLLQRLARGDSSGRAAVFLFAEPSLLSLLADLEQQSIEINHHLIELEPWSVAEIGSYLQTRLQIAGRSLDIFTDAELEEVYEQSYGWPGRINQIAKELLVQRLFDQPRRKAFAFTRLPALPSMKALPYKYLLVLLLLAFTFIYVLYQEDEQVLQVQTTELTRQPVERSMVASERVAEQTTRMALPPPGTVQPVTLEPAVEQPAVVEAPQPVLEPVIAEKPAPEPVAAPVVVAPPAPKPVVQAATTPVVTRAAQGGDWYAQQRAGNYALQVFASSSEKSARDFVHKHGAQFKYFRKQHQGGYLYVITYGSFATAEQAAAAQQKMPGDLRNNKPWPRTFASIRKEIR